MMRWFGSLGLLLALAVAPLHAENVRRVVLEGFDEVPVAQIRQDLPLKPGEQYTAAAGENARTWLENLGVFSKVELIAVPQGQVVDLTFKVVENPLVQLVRLQGNTQISSAALRPSLQTVPKQVLSTVAVALDANVIGKAYLDNGMRVIVDASFEPPPTDPKKPVTVTFRIVELKVGPVNIEPLRYVKKAALDPFIVLQEGELLTEQRLVEQRRKLYEAGLFRSVSPADPGEALMKPVAAADPQNPARTPMDGFLPLTYHVAEMEYPLLSAETLPRVDLAALAGTVRFSAVEVPVERRDFVIWQSPDELQAQLEAAKAAAQGGNAAALYEVYTLTRRVGGDAKAAAQAAQKALAPIAATNATARMHLAQVLWFLNEDQAAIDQATLCTADPATCWEAWELLLDARMSNLSQSDPAGADALSKTLRDGLAALAEASTQPDLAGLISAYRFYYTALTLALIKPELKITVALDSPASRTLITWVVAHDKSGLTDAEARQVGRMLTAAGFAAYATGGDAAPPAVWTHYQSLLKLARENLLVRGLEGSDDPAAFYFTALCDLLRDDAPSARAIALKGLAEQPDNERLVDAYILACVQDRGASDDPQRTVDILKASIADLQPKIATPQYGTWGGLMLLAKLQLALRDKLPESDTVGREQARTAAEAAIQNAVAKDRNNPSGWWILAMTQLKGRQPGTALASYQQVEKLNPDYREVKYALALAKLLAGDTAGGLAAMQVLAAPAPPKG